MDRTTELWVKRLNSARRKPRSDGKSGRADDETRTEIERDYDRILFSTPSRRLADKTQVFPLERNDSVRTRLTHSHEVSNLARSIGTSLAFVHGVARDVPNTLRDIPALLATVGLLHDLGNPPFGHQGEAAICRWFERNMKIVGIGEGMTDSLMNDFLFFEGNAQTFRLITKLQVLNDDFGLDLTYATLAASMKYSSSSGGVDKAIAARKKFGFFLSEESIAKEALTAVGLEFGQRHPLAYVMEACDDIAYSVLDVEDAVKKGLASFSDLMAYLEHNGKNDLVLEQVVASSRKKHEDYRTKAKGLSPAELNDISMQLFRVYAIKAMVLSVTGVFIEHQMACVEGVCEKPLLKMSSASVLRDQLQEFASKHAYSHRSVLEVELQGFNVLQDLLDMLWVAIVDREDRDQAGSKRCSPFSRYAYARISENYRRVFESSRNDMPMAYRECQLLTDMISGMTDSFALSLHKELLKYRGDFSTTKFKNNYKKRFQKETESIS